MSDKMIRCVRCNGRKKVYKINGGYTHVNMGGPEVECPMCKGKGQVKSIGELLKELENKGKENEKETDEKARDSGKRQRKEKTSGGETNEVHTGTGEKDL